MHNLLPFEKHEREILIRKTSETNPTFGLSPEKRSIEEIIPYGIVNIDKPRGPTSHQVSDYVQKILGISKSGHSGTLDPNVTGVLPIALGRGTRIVQTLLNAGKEYIALMHIHKDADEEKIKQCVGSFIGKIKQMPPIKSSVKRRMRQREIYYLDILEIDNRDVLFRVGCEAGTYIRKLIHDIGVKLNTGAHMAELRRTKAGPFDESTLATLHDLKDAYHFWKENKDESYLRKIIQPIENAVMHLPKIWVFDTAVETLCHGSELKVPGISKLEAGIKKGDTVAIMTLKSELICLGKSLMNSNQILGERGIAVKTEKVFMLTGSYIIDNKEKKDNTPK